MKLAALFPLIAFLAVAAPPASEVEITAEPHHHLELENAYVRVFKVEVPPQQATLMHRHRHDYVYVTLGAAAVSNEVEGKPPASMKLQDGETNFLPGNFAHIARNLARTPFRNVTIELLQDKQARLVPPAKWDAERGMEVFAKGTKDIQFVKDGVRVSDIQLQPGGRIPKHYHAGPHMLVAVSDVDLRSDTAGNTSIKMKAGDVVWLRGKLTHAVINSGNQPARFVTLEFK
jgi:quercetin dioxygenase-like cupin family protein